MRQCWWHEVCIVIPIDTPTLACHSPILIPLTMQPNEEIIHGITTIGRDKIRVIGGDPE